ncbi:metal ABC transporter substrate-binding protein [Jiangella mangrovi]|uniref:Zinc transport system substrate-binding protein n=1 Tax=Jiangella mangrovi TaxID=1524084 RepID=A0A7W9LQ04_9ACTN|nr:metal ABC transporter substrate-binding protein [Jiangella mangrovi]MBB5791950.1 zinc transport system substrate-binding protein [Jiangella mangrovi]
MKNRRAAAAALSTAALAGLLLTSCGDGGDATASGGDGPTVAAAFYPLAFVTQQVAGDHATVENLTQAGGEPHDLELTGRQVGEIADADLVVYLAGFQPSVDEAIEQNAEDRAVDVAGLVELLDNPEDHGDEHAEEEHAEDEDHEGHDHGDLAGDPHIWLDPTNLEPIAAAVADRLAEADPDHADDYHANADALTTELEALDQEFEAGLAQCTQRVFVVAHEAFGYLAHRYDLEQVGISGIDPEAEPSPERLAEVHDVVRAEGVTTILYERLVSPDVAETLANDLGVEAAVLDPIEGLTDDTSDQDYFSLMRANLEALRSANGCS